MLRNRLSRIALLLTAGVLLAAPVIAALAQSPPTGAGRVVVQQVHAESLEQTVTGEASERTVAVYLPPTYESSDRRYPVLYLLHGIGATHTDWTEPWNGQEDAWSTIAGVMDRGIAEGRLAEMIVVMPDQSTRSGGSWYINSTVTGRWEDFTSVELVHWVDERFRTLAAAESRGVAGHSMGGYGAIVLGMKHPDVFSAVYGLSSAILGWGADLTAENPAFRTVLGLSDWDEIGGIWEAGLICLGQAFSPNPDRPPFFVDWPFEVGAGGQLVPAKATFSKWEEHMPVAMAARYSGNLLKLRGLRFDAGYDDEFTHIPAVSRTLSQVLDELGVPHVFEEYNGDHRNRLWGRTGRFSTDVLPWFSLVLQGQATDR